MSFYTLWTWIHRNEASMKKLKLNEQPPPHTRKLDVVCGTHVPNRQCLLSVRGSPTFGSQRKTIPLSFLSDRCSLGKQRVSSLGYSWLVFQKGTLLPEFSEKPSCKGRMKSLLNNAGITRRRSGLGWRKQGGREKEMRQFQKSETLVGSRDYLLEATRHPNRITYTSRLTDLSIAHAKQIHSN